MFWEVKVAFEGASLPEIIFFLAHPFENGPDTLKKRNSVIRHRSSLLATEFRRLESGIFVMGWSTERWAKRGNSRGIVGRRVYTQGGGLYVYLLLVMRVPLSVAFYIVAVRARISLIIHHDPNKHIYKSLTNVSTEHRFPSLPWQPRLSLSTRLKNKCP